MLALVLEVFAAVGPCRPVQVSEASLPCFAYAHYSLLPSSWYTVASLPEGLVEVFARCYTCIDSRHSSQDSHVSPCGHLSPRLSFCLGACRQLLDGADAGIQANRRRIVESSPKNHGEPDYTCTYFDILLVFVSTGNPAPIRTVVSPPAVGVVTLACS